MIVLEVTEDKFGKAMKAISKITEHAECLHDLFEDLAEDSNYGDRYGSRYGNRREYDDDDEIVLNVKAIKRNKFYKSRQKNKQRKRNLNKDTIEESKNEDVFNQVPENSERKSKTTKKKVAFLRNYVTIIEVESYKKFNYLNAYEDPYEDALSVFGNINLLNGEDEEDENTRLNCACFIF